MSKAYIDPERCKGCGLCIHYCSKDAISMTDEINTRGYKHIAVDLDRCIGCGICYIICPDAVFTITERKEG